MLHCECCCSSQGLTVGGQLVLLLVQVLDGMLLLGLWSLHFHDMALQLVLLQVPDSGPLPEVFCLAGRVEGWHTVC